uniref:protein bicaudal C homolog 1-like isoform X2 n=1 Tax=Ciona intestinalis TaxID=7719 RepID=UPI00089DC2DB|nr:protein bicaudal C homolog 1-like isoform X2 [Ciona intestinalis]|eukprot:XP_018667910.1 protein bicaudal C homolog 1-like isoform X2 [Ciona intestinalis]
MAVNSNGQFDGAASWSGDLISQDSPSLTTAAEATTADDSVLFNVNNAQLSATNHSNNNSNNNCNIESRVYKVNSIDSNQTIVLDPNSGTVNDLERLNTTHDINDTHATVSTSPQKPSVESNILKCENENLTLYKSGMVQSIDESNTSSDTTDVKKQDSMLNDKESIVASSEVLDGEEEQRDPEWTEERFRVDRRKLEQMLQAAVSGKGQGGEEFFNQIMEATNTQITWPSKLKIGAKSRKDPHIKVCGKQENVSTAKEMVMQVLDTKCTRVTLKMDVSHTEHSHVIGKGGNNIKRVMEETGCHIHFPDSNRNSSAEKSNQVSIAGQPMGVEVARSKIRDLLPIIINFDISLSGALPDPNSPPIQQIVLTYNISVQFKQRAKVYCTTCTIRGSNDNVSGLIEGANKLMRHLTGGVVPVSSQIEVAPQQHLYMLGKDAANVKDIMHKTGAQIRFPDPNSLPKKSTIFITGSIEAVVMSRGRLMGCLPLVLMFDMKQDESQSATEEAIKNSQLMELLDVFISIKMKPKQPSKSVIVKSVERNIHKMFEARRQLLNLPSTGLQPSPPVSPQPIQIQQAPAVTSTPLIRLTHAPSSHVQPQYIGILQPNMTLVNGAMSPISRTGTPNVPPMMQSWSHNRMPSPAQSPYPMTQQATVAAIQAQQQQHMMLQAQLTAQQQLTAAVIASANASRASSVAGSPPTLQHRQESSERLASPNAMNMQVARQFIKENLSASHDVNPPYSGFEQPNQYTRDGGGVDVHQQDGSPVVVSENWAESEESLPNTTNYYPYENKSAKISSNVRGLQRHILNVQNLREGSLSANNSFNKGNSNSLSLHRHSISTDNITQDEVNTKKLKQTRGSSLDVETFSASGHRRNLIPSQTSSPGSDQNVPISGKPDKPSEPSTSDNYVKQVNAARRSPSSSSSSADLHSSLPRMHGSPTRGQYLHPDHANYDRSIDGRSSLSEGVKNAYISAAESNNDDDLRELKKYFQSPAPPPGFEQLAMSSHSTLTDYDYETRRQEAYKAMQHRPVATEIRKPTDTWSGLGFSHSMPVNQLKQEKDKYKLKLTTTYEGEDGQVYEEEKSAEAGYLGMSQQLANSSKGSSALSSWRERNNHNLSHSLHSKVGDLSNAIPKRRQHSTFDPLPKEYMNHSIPPPPHPNDDPTPPPTFRPQRTSNNPPGDSVTRLPGGVIANQPLEAALSLLTDTHLGGQSNCIELHDLLSHLNLEKYSEVFTKQEVDLQTFLTLTESDLTELGITIFGPKKKILMAIEELKKNRNILYANNINPNSVERGVARQPAPEVLPNNSRKQVLDNLLQNCGNRDSTHLRGNQANMLSNSRLVHHTKGIVSQSGRW